MAGSVCRVNVAEYVPMLRAVAEAVAHSLAAGTPLQEDGLGESLRDALMAENADACEDAAKHCWSLRAALAAEVRCALAREPETAPLVFGGVGANGTVPPVRVEIRGTAGRQVLGSAFAVGRAAECEVQAVGDGTVLPVQCICVPLPGGIVVADWWSGGSTRMTWRRSAHLPASPVAAAAQRAAFVVAHGERVILRIGARTTITLGPTGKKLAELQQRGAPVLAADEEARLAKAASKAQRMCASAKWSEASTSCESLFSGSASAASSRSRSPNRRPQTPPAERCH